VSEMILLQYVGFENRGAVREYTFTLAGSGGTSTEYFVTIANAAFVAHRVRYQDGPEICSLRLRREFASWTDQPPSTRFSVTDAELADYMDAHAPKPKPGASAYRKDQEF
jgi:type IV secretory pathway VirJ component